MRFEDLLMRIGEKLHRMIQHNKEELIGKSGLRDLTVSQLYYLEAIHRLDSPLPTELAGHMSVTKASTSGAIKKLKAMDLIELTPSADDGRAFHIRLSKSGRKLMRAELEAFTEFARQIEDAITPADKQSLIRILDRILRVSE